MIFITQPTIRKVMKHFLLFHYSLTLLNNTRSYCTAHCTIVQTVGQWHVMAKYHTINVSRLVKLRLCSKVPLQIWKCFFFLFCPFLPFSRLFICIKTFALENRLKINYSKLCKNSRGWVIKHVFNGYLGNGQTTVPQYGGRCTIVLDLQPWTIVHQIVHSTSGQKFWPLPKEPLNRCILTLSMIRKSLDRTTAKNNFQIWF